MYISINKYLNLIFNHALLLCNSVLFFYPEVVILEHYSLYNRYTSNIRGRCTVNTIEISVQIITTNTSV